MTTIDDLSALGRQLDAAARRAQPVPQLTASRSLDLDAAYAIQHANVAQRLDRGEQLIGLKMGFTSRAKALQMGVADVICGRLTDRMLIADGGSVRLRDFIHPRVEPEIAFLLRSPLAGRVASLEALTAVAAVAPALEIIDSRFQDFRFSLADVVADNSSSAACVIGPWQPPGIELDNLGLVMSFDGVPETLGSTAAILGHPARSLVAAARLAAERGIELVAGSIVLAGGATEARPLRAGLQVAVEIQCLGRAALNVEK